MASIKFTVAVQGLRELRRKTAAGEQLLAPPLHDAMEEIGSTMLSAARAAAPQGRGQAGRQAGMTATLLRSRMQAKPLPLWVRVETTAVRPWSGHGNYSYPKRVEWDPRLHHAGWLRGAIKRLSSRFDSALAAAGKKIEERWSA